MIYHDGHADFTSLPIIVTVEEEVHCEDLVDESSCMADDHDDADEMA